MNLEEMKYDAFISYRHCELDQFVAVTLHKELEAFRLPKSIQKQLAEKGIEKKKIERVFRDRDELPITNNLADPITNALRNSEFLLVICSPRLSQSMWCRKEIETFISMHGRERVFAVLIEGEPDESFPEELLYEERKTVDENGVEHIERVPIEPLAADVRGKNKSEIHKKIKEEVIRLAAPIFGCSYDDLKQRHRERMMRRIITTACAVSTVFGSFGVISTTMAIRIQKQSEQIQEQSEEIQFQADQIELQYQEALKTNARQMAEDAFDSMDAGDMESAVQTSYQALTHVDGADMPYTAEAEFALSTALQTYRNGSQIMSQRILEQESQVNFCKISPDGNMLAVVDIFGNLEVYRPLTGELLYKTAMTGYVTYLAEEKVCFIGNTTIAYPMEDGFVIYDLETKELKEYTSEYTVSALHADREGIYLAMIGYDGLIVYDVSTMEPVYTMKAEEGVSFQNACEFSRELPGKLAFEYDTYVNRAGICLVDIKEQTSIMYDSQSDSIMDIWFDQNDVFFCGFSNVEDDDSRVYCIDTAGKLKWVHVLSGVPDQLVTFGEGETDKLAYSQYSKMTILNKADGTVMTQEDFGREIVDYCAYEDSEVLTLMTREGSYYYYMPENETAITYEGKFVSTSDNLKGFDFGNGFYVSYEYASNSLVVYERAIGSNVKQLIDTDYSVTGTKISPDGKYLVIDASDLNTEKLVVFHAEDGSIASEIAFEDYVTDFTINPEGELVVLLNDSIEVYNLADGSQISMRATTSENGKLVRNGEAYAALEEGITCIIDVKTGDVLASVEEERIIENGLMASTVDEEGLYYAFSDEENKKVVIGSFEDEGIIEIPLNVNAVEMLAIAPNSKTLYVTYLDENVEAYDFMTGNLAMTYGILNGGVENVVELDNIGRTVLQSLSKAYLINDDKDVIAFLQGYSDYNAKNDSFIIDDTSKVYEVKRYEVDDLIKEAETFLGE